jgi:hypothetical protein
LLLPFIVSEVKVTSVPAQILFTDDFMLIEGVLRGVIATVSSFDRTVVTGLQEN